MHANNPQPSNDGATRHLWVNAKLATFDPSIHLPYGLRDGWTLATEGDRIVAFLPPDAPGIRTDPGMITDVGGRWITPGFIDCHTQLIYGGTRVLEWEKRLRGMPYAEIAREGGGILSTVRATRAC